MRWRVDNLIRRWLNVASLEKRLYGVFFTLFVNNLRG